MPTNKQRAERAHQTLHYFCDLTDLEVNEPKATVLTDLLSNLMHYCDESDPYVSFDDCLRIAGDHHTAEVLEPKEERKLKYVCGNCDKGYFEIDDMAEIRDLTQRVEPGGTMPAGECHECSGLCYLIEPPEAKLWHICVAGHDSCIILKCPRKPTVQEIAKLYAPKMKGVLPGDLRMNEITGIHTIT